MMRLSPIRYGVRINPVTIPGPVLNWRMNESSGSVIDYSGNGYNGTVNGSPTRTVSALGGNLGLQLTASGHGVSIDKASCPLARDAMLSQNYTASIVAETSTGSSVNPCPFVFWVSANNGTKVLRLGGSSSPRYASWTSSGGVSDYGAVLAGGDSSLQVVTYVRTPTEGRLYSNGSLVATATYSSGVNVANAGAELIQVGGHLDFPSSYQYIGRVSDLVIWDTALSDAQVTELSLTNGRV